MTAARATVLAYRPAVPKSVLVAYSLLRAQAERSPAGDDNAVTVAASVMLGAALRGDA